MGWHFIWSIVPIGLPCSEADHVAGVLCRWMRHRVCWVGFFLPLYLVHHANGMPCSGAVHVAAAFIQAHDVLQSLCCWDAVQVDEAQSAFRESLEITEKLLGADHPVVANRLNNLASVLAEQGESTEAEVGVGVGVGVGALVRLVKQAWQHLIECMPIGQQQQQQHLEMMRRALQSRMKVLGEEHSDTVVSLNNLASLLFQQGKTAEAVPLYKQEVLEC
eukprot:1161992-Pelagomonas_calceolata.AAC.8